jgi:hypothetical protein
MLHQGNLHLFNISLLLACVLFLNSLPALWLDLCISICKLKCFWFPLSRVEVVGIVGFSFITHLWSWYCLSFFPLGTTINPLLYFLLIGIRLQSDFSFWLPPSVVLCPSARFVNSMFHLWLGRVEENPAVISIALGVVKWDGTIRIN